MYIYICFVTVLGTSVNEEAFFLDNSFIAIYFKCWLVYSSCDHEAFFVVVVFVSCIFFLHRPRVG